MTLDYKMVIENQIMPLILMEPSEYTNNKCVMQNDKVGIWLYQANCLELMDKISEKYPEGKFDMIFADPPIFYLTGELLAIQEK